MQRPTKRTTVLAGVAGLGVVGALGVALAASPAQAEDPTPTPSSSAAAGAPSPQPSASGSAAPGTGTGRPDLGDPGDRGDRGGRMADHAARQQELAAALAAELGIDQAKVAAALEKVEADRAAAAKADRLADLKTRLDAAVKEGRLTADQAAAILKAAEAGVLPPGGGRGGHGR